MSHLRALLLTDVVDSTKLSLRLGDEEMARLWVAHDRAARDLLPVWHGREIDKPDGMLLLFDAASDAVGYALAYQQALNRLVLPLKTRAGLHVGLVTLRENSPSDVAQGAKPIEVEGVAKATAARVMSVAIGGQILLSADARQSLGADGLRLQSHGHWRLKGLDEPLELFEIGDEDVPFVPPPDSDKAYRVVHQGELWSPGGLTLEAAEGVLDLSDCGDTPWTVDIVQSLVDKSFVRTRGDDRFDLLVSVQAYAAEHLETEGHYAGSGPQALGAVQLRHLAWFAALGPIRAAAGRCADLDNLAAACRRAVALSAGDLATGALKGAWAALSLRGPFETGVELAEWVCAMPGLNDRAAAHAQSVLAISLVTCGRSGPARAMYDLALATAKAAGDRSCEAMLTFRLGSLHESTGRMHEARAQHISAIQMARELGDPQLECMANSGLGNIDVVEGRTDDALSRYERALALAGETRDLPMQGNLLGKLHMETGRTDEAKVRCE